MSPGLICLKLRTSGPATTSTVLPLSPCKVMARVAGSTAVTLPVAVVIAAPTMRAEAAMGIASVLSNRPVKARRAMGLKTDVGFFMVWHPPREEVLGKKHERTGITMPEGVDPSSE